MLLQIPVEISDEQQLKSKSVQRCAPGDTFRGKHVSASFDPHKMRILFFPSELASIKKAAGTHFKILAHIHMMCYTVYANLFD